VIPGTFPSTEWDESKATKKTNLKVELSTQAALANHRPSREEGSEEDQRGLWSKGGRELGKAFLRGGDTSRSPPAWWRTEQSNVLRERGGGPRRRFSI